MERDKKCLSRTVNGGRESYEEIGEQKANLGEVMD